MNELLEAAETLVDQLDKNQNNDKLSINAQSDLERLFWDALQLRNSISNIKSFWG
jgi:hypothetical protein